MNTLKHQSKHHDNMPNLTHCSDEFFDHYKELKYLRSLRLVTKGITHNYNNIFAGILGNVGTTGIGEKPEKVEILDTLISRAIRETEVLFDFARYGIDTPNTITVFGVVEEAVKALRLISPKYNIDLIYNNADVKVKGFHSELALMLFFLGENSIEAMPGGGDLLFEIIHYNENGTTPSVKIVVSDDGPGVDSQIEAKMFSPFISSKKEGTSLGLGLFFARQIAKAHGGQLHYSKDHIGEGAFVAKLPTITTETIKTDSYLETRGAQSTTQQGKEKHIFFVIDDDPVLLNYLIDGLQRLGHMVFSASNYQEALEEFKNVKNIVNVLLVDIGLADIDGVEFVAKLNQMYELPKVIFMSGDVHSGSIERIPGAEYLAKPFTIKELEGLVINVAD